MRTNPDGWFDRLLWRWERYDERRPLVYVLVPSVVVLALIIVPALFICWLASSK